MIEAVIGAATEALAWTLGALGFDGLAERFEEKRDPRNFPPPR